MRILCKSIPSIICLLILNSGYCLSQIQMMHPYDKFIETINDLSKNAVFIQTSTGYGSGVPFMIPFKDSPEKGDSYVVTAKHVMGSKFDSLKRPIEFHKGAFVFMKTYKGVVDKRRYKLVFISDSLDIAILRPIDIFRPYSEYDMTTLAADNEIASYNELKIGQVVIISGYPFGIGGVKLMPVVQSGIISFVDTTQSLALIDIPVNYGNSGSPAITFTTEGKARLAGLVVAYLSNQQDSVYSGIEKKNIADNASLGTIVLLTSVIKYIKTELERSKKK